MEEKDYGKMTPEEERRYRDNLFMTMSYSHLANVLGMDFDRLKEQLPEFTDRDEVFWKGLKPGHNMSKSMALHLVEQYWNHVCFMRKSAALNVVESFFAQLERYVDAEIEKKAAVKDEQD